MAVTRDMEEAMRNADVVVANTFHSMAHDAQKEERKKTFAPYQINARSVSLAKPDYMFMHSGPAYVGEEVTEEIIYGPHSTYYDKAENRMHTEKAVLVLSVGQKYKTRRKTHGTTAETPEWGNFFSVGSASAPTGQAGTEACPTILCLNEGRHFFVDMEAISAYQRKGDSR